MIIMVEKNGLLKITVLRRFAPEEVFDEKPIEYGEMGPCDKYKDGQEFIVDQSWDMPEGFCAYAWDDIYKTVLTLLSGGDFPWYTEKGASVSCCTDGLRPVVFRIERI